MPMPDAPSRDMRVADAANYLPTTLGTRSSRELAHDMPCCTLRGTPPSYDLNAAKKNDDAMLQSERQTNAACGLAEWGRPYLEGEVAHWCQALCGRQEKG